MTTFDNDRHNYVANLWPSPTPEGGDSLSTTITDEIWHTDGTPTPQNPASNPATPGYKVFDLTQHIWLGSSLCNGTGCRVKTVKQTYHINCGRHL